MLILNTSVNCDVIPAEKFCLWPLSLALFFLLFFFIAMWEVEAGTNLFISSSVPEKHVYNFVCILKIYCDTFNLGEKFP